MQSTPLVIKLRRRCPRLTLRAGLRGRRKLSPTRAIARAEIVRRRRLTKKAQSPIALWPRIETVVSTWSSSDVPQWRKSYLALARHSVSWRGKAASAIASGSPELAIAIFVGISVSLGLYNEAYWDFVRTHLDVGTYTVFVQVHSHASLLECAAYLVFLVYLTIFGVETRSLTAGFQLLLFGVGYGLALNILRGFLRALATNSYDVSKAVVENMFTISVAAIGGLITLLTILALRVVLFFISSKLGSERYILLILLGIIGGTNPEKSFPMHMRRKAGYIQSLSTTAYWIDHNLMEQMKLSRHSAHVVRRRLNMAAERVRELRTWVALPQAATRTDFQCAVVEVFAPFLTGQLDYLPQPQMRPAVESRPGPEKRDDSERGRELLGQAAKRLLAPALLVGAGLNGMLLPESLRQWATGFGALWFVFAVAATFSPDQGAVIGSVKDALSTVNQGKDK